MRKYLLKVVILLDHLPISKFSHEKSNTKIKGEFYLYSNMYSVQTVPYMSPEYDILYLHSRQMTFNSFLLRKNSIVEEGFAVFFSLPLAFTYIYR
jgi:hypothetical protein